MEKQETIIEFLLNKVAELTIENKRLNELVGSLQADCYYYSNYWQPKENENKRLEEENKKLKEKLSEITMVADDEKQSIEHILELEEENKKLKETIKDHQLYEEKLEHRIIEFEELLHGE